MTEPDDNPVESQSLRSRGRKKRKAPLKGRQRLIITSASIIVLGTLSSCAWLGLKASEIKTELESAMALVAPLKNSLSTAHPENANDLLRQMRSHTATAKRVSEDPIWTLASSLPGIGSNFSAVAEVARSAHDVTALGLTPLVNVFGSLDWNALLPTADGADLVPLAEASPSISAASNAVRLSNERLERIDTHGLLPQVAGPLGEAKVQLGGATGALDAAADASEVAPAMLGVTGPRNYLLMIQNNAEARASGGIPGALCVLTVENGKLSLGTQSSAGDIGPFTPGVPVDSEQQQIYSGRLGKFMQDVNLTPDFPSAAKSAQAMWERSTGQRVDGVLSIDPVALGYVLDATGPLKITSPQLMAAAQGGLPAELTGENVVRTLLSDVYSAIEQPELQDAYFAGVAQEIFSALSSGKGDAPALFAGIARGTDEGRVLVWSASAAEQQVLSKYAVSGSITGHGVSPTQFGIFFNDGTGAKMDYYAKRSVQLVKECPKDGYEQVSVRITSTNTAPADASTKLPRYVTGDGVFGIPAGSLQTNIVAYGPVQSHVETAKVDGQRTAFAPHVHGSRPVGVIAVRLAPGESKTVEFKFGKIVQHSEPNVFVTPTVQPVKDVTLPTENASCD